MESLSALVPCSNQSCIEVLPAALCVTFGLLQHTNEALSYAEMDVFGRGTPVLLVQFFVFKYIVVLPGLDVTHVGCRAAR